MAKRKIKKLPAHLVVRYYLLYKKYVETNILVDDSEALSITDLVDFVENNMESDLEESLEVQHSYMRFKV